MSGSSSKSDLERVYNTQNAATIHQFIDQYGIGEKMMNAVALFLEQNYKLSFEETADGTAWDVRRNGELIGSINDEEIANITAGALLEHDMDWDAAVADVCQWVGSDKLSLPAVATSEVNAARRGNSEKMSVVQEFLRRAQENLRTFGPETDMEIEIPSTIDDDDLWWNINDAMRSNGISYSISEEQRQSGYTYYYINLRRQDSSTGR